MNRILNLTLMVFLLAGCTARPIQPTASAVPMGTPEPKLPNPASVYCTQQGNRLEIRTAADGSQSGVCIFPDGSTCDEWAYYRGECKAPTEPSATPEVDSAGWKTYRDELHGYQFRYPADAEIITNDEPLKSLNISGPGLGNEFWNISHPGDREEYRPPEGVDLEKWLRDHYLVGEKRAEDVQIAGTTAIHYRHERSPQSYADDRYYFARAGQLYLVLIGHGSESEDWELNNRFLQSIQFGDEPSNAPGPTAIPTAIAMEPADYQGWWTYTHAGYGFAIRLPEDWIVDETTRSDPLLNGHLLSLHPRQQATFS